MTEQELRQLRRVKWRLENADAPMRTLEDAQEFIESAGFATLYPTKPALLAPTFLGAYVGDDANLPTWQHAYSDPRAQEALPLMVRLLRSKSAYEANLFGESNFLISASAFPYFYALVGDKNPKRDPKKFSTTKTSPLANDIFKLIQEKGPQTKQQIQEQLSGALSNVAVERALNELWTLLKITRVDHEPGQGSTWDALHRWSPEVVKEGIELSHPEALSALVSKYLDAVVAAEQGEVEDFFSHFTSRAKTRDAIHALLAARELSFVMVGSKTMLQMTPAKVAHVPKVRDTRPVTIVPVAERPVSKPRFGKGGDRKFGRPKKFSDSDRKFGGKKFGGPKKFGNAKKFGSRPKPKGPAQ
jgi:23S rRNA pseudouridine2605 synthase